jgi:hypothetical protein
MSYDPIRHDSLVRFGYTFKSASACKECQQAIEWWQTKAGKSVCFNPAGSPSAIVVCHWDTCPVRKQQRERQGPPAFANKQAAVEDFRKRCRARVVMVLMDEGWHADVMPDLAAEEVKHELITAANALRRAMGGR